MQRIFTALAWRQVLPAADSLPGSARPGGDAALLPPQDLILISGDGGVLAALAVDVPGARLVTVDAVTLPSSRPAEPWAGAAAAAGLDCYGRLLRVDPAGRAAALAARRGRLALLPLVGRPGLAPPAAATAAAGEVFRRASGGGVRLIRAACPDSDIGDMAFLPPSAEFGDGGSGEEGAGAQPLRLAVLSRRRGGASALWLFAAGGCGDGDDADARLTHRWGPPATDLQP
jgi:hypothetical protein